MILDYMLISASCQAPEIKPIGGFKTCLTFHTRWSRLSVPKITQEFLYVCLTCIFWIADRERALFDLFLKQVFLVEEENDGGVCEPLVVAD